jgi:glucose/arabinose dehydrogenase
VARAGRVIAILAAATTAVLALAAAAEPSSTRTFTVRVDARDFSFALSRKSVPVGSTVRFVVRNRGAQPHDFLVKKKRTRLLRPGQTQTITVAFPKMGRFAFLCTISGHARLGMRGQFGVAVKPVETPPPTKPPVNTSDLVSLTPVATFDTPVLVTAPAGDDDRVFVVEQTGTVRLVRDGVTSPTPFLDIRDKVIDQGESGLLSIAFAPDYAQSGLIYAIYNARMGPYGDLQIAEFRRDPFDPDRADPSYERVLLTIPKPYENHNGGMLQFGPDGDLYVSVGDGDPGVLHKAGAFAQRLDVLLGRILRIDPRRGDPFAVPADNPFVGVPDARPEIWAYGLRNPWRFWIDRETDTLYVPDVGSTSREEINVVPNRGRADNFGWPCFEGSLVFDASAMCSRAMPPLVEYQRAGGECAVIGGVVARDPRIPELTGRYLFGDLCSGKVTALLVQGGKVSASGDLGLEIPELTSFGIDGLGRIYVMSLQGGVYRLDPKQPG